MSVIEPVPRDGESPDWDAIRARLLQGANFDNGPLVLHPWTVELMVDMGMVLEHEGHPIIRLSLNSEAE